MHEAHDLGQVGLGGGLGHRQACSMRIPPSILLLRLLAGQPHLRKKNQKREMQGSVRELLTLEMGHCVGFMNPRACRDLWTGI